MQRAEWGVPVQTWGRGEDATEPAHREGFTWPGGPPRERRSAPLWRGLSGAPSGCPGPPTGGSCLCRPGAPACGPRLEVPGLGTLGRGPASHTRGLHLKPAVAKACSSSLTSWIFRAVLACDGWDCLGIYIWPPRGKGSCLPVLCLKNGQPSFWCHRKRRGHIYTPGFSSAPQMGSSLRAGKPGAGTWPGTPGVHLGGFVVLSSFIRVVSSSPEALANPQQ